VDKDIMLYGLCLFGSKNNDYSVALTIEETGAPYFTLVSKTGTFSSKLLQSSNGNYCGLEILFDPTVVCNKNTKYEINAVVSGPPSWKGIDGVSTVVCSGVTFTFKDITNISIHSNGTTVRDGQFPEIMFSVLP